MEGVEEKIINRIKRKRRPIYIALDPRIYKISFYLRKERGYPFSRMVDMGLLFLFTKHFEVVEKRIKSIDVILENDIEIKQKFEEYLAKIKNMEGVEEIGSQHDVRHEHL
jgi:hypothetical protein